MSCAIRSPQDVCQNFEHTTPSGGYTAWTMYMVNDTVVVNKATATVGNEAVMYYEIPKVVVDCLTITDGNLASYDEGCKVYHDSGTDAITHTPSGTTTLCGIVTQKPSVGDTTCEIHLMGALGIVA